MQLLRGCPWCHLNSALPPLFSIHLSACVPKHFCLMTSSLCFSQFSPLIDPLLLLLFFFFYLHYYVECWLCSVLCYNGMRDWESESEQWVCCLLVSTAILPSFSPRRAPHGQRTHGEDKQLFGFDNRCQWDLSLTVSVFVHKRVCLWESVNVFVWGFQREYRSRMAKHRVYSLSFLAQGKVRHVSIHRHKTLEAN